MRVSDELANLICNEIENGMKEGCVVLPTTDWESFKNSHSMNEAVRHEIQISFPSTYDRYVKEVQEYIETTEKAARGKRLGLDSIDWKYIR